MTPLSYHSLSLIALETLRLLVLIYVFVNLSIYLFIYLLTD